MNPSGSNPKVQQAWFSLLKSRTAGLACFTTLILVWMSLWNPTFLAWSNLRDIAVAAAPVCIISCGLMLVLVLGEIDISVGSMMGVLAAAMGAMASASRWHLPPGVAMVGTLTLGVFIGAINGWLVAYLKVPSIMVTLGMLTALRGVTEVIMGGQWITDLPPELRSLGTGTWLGIPICLWVTAAVVLISLWLIHRSTLGRRIYAIGSHPKAARLAGLPIARTQCLVFAWTGFLTAVATLVSVPQLSVVLKWGKTTGSW